MDFLFGDRSTESRWDGSKIPPLEGKVAVVTGANSGIGFETTRQLALHGASVVLACRSKTRGREALDKIRTELFEAPDSSLAKRGSVELMLSDMGEPESVRELAAKLHEHLDHIDVLVNNTGIASPPSPTTDSTGLESQFAINYLGHFQLTALVLDLLEKAVDTSGEPARVVNVSSLLHYYAWPFWRVDKLGERAKGHIWGYYTSKLAQLMSTFELDRRLRRKGGKKPSVLVTAAHPGASHTPMFSKYYFSKLLRVLQAPTTTAFSLLPINSPEMGALPILYAATALGVESGAYFGPDGWFGIRGFPTAASSSSLSHSEEEAAKLYNVSERLSGTVFRV